MSSGKTPSSSTAKHEQALQVPKAYLTHPLLLSKPKPNETTVSAVRVRKEDSKQPLVYYVSKSLLDAKSRYAYLENLEIV